MTTPRQMQIARRLHHRISPLNPGETIDVEVRDVQAVLAALWAEIDRANAAEDRLANRPVTKRVPYLRVYNPGRGHAAEITEASRPVA